MPDTVRAWGANDFGQLGDGTTTNRTTPVQVQTLRSVEAVTAGFEHSLALLSNSTVSAWGDNSSGQLGDGTTTNRTTPVQVQTSGGPLSGVEVVAASGLHSLALLADGTVHAWGRNDFGQLGDGTTTNRTTPVQVQTPPNVIAVAAGSGHSLALQSGLLTTTVFAWGRNNFGQLGDGTTTNRTTSVQVQTLLGVLSEVTAVGAGFHSLALQSGLLTTTVFAWGRNDFGQLGDGTTTNRNKAVRVQALGGLLSGVEAVTAGAFHSLARLPGGSARAWGRNDFGQLGDGTTTNRNKAGVVPNLRSVETMAANGFHTLAIVS